MTFRTTLPGLELIQREVLFSSRRLPSLNL
uniref:Uncharacterized protein n=1 Tax=Utricularia reniformis TaxID=192314 RepID=A0A1Y0B4B2_9LAMI|nr:hypothetical protein AEK19_MT2067 [Utricularia reniformis]ART32223.1 hypothetical protein AEK19_MT2067 [Utricularia reniformis]